MIRSGSTLQFQIASHLAESHSLGKRWAWLQPEQLETRLKNDRAEPGLRVIKTRTLPQAAVPLLMTGQALALYCFRDLRDVAVSAMRAFNCDWPKLREERCLINAVENERAWRSQPRVLVQRYEEIIANLPVAVEEIARHLNIQLSDGEARSVAEYFNRENQGQRIEQWIESAPPDQDFHPTELLRREHLPRDKIVDWKDALPSAIAEEITSQFSVWLEEHGYPLVAPAGLEVSVNEQCFVPHVGWMTYESGDAVLAGLREGDFEFLEQATLCHLLRPGDTVVDCGAHCGLYTRLAGSLVSPGGFVAASEPDPNSFARLTENTLELPAGLTALHRVAIGGFDGEVGFSSGPLGKAAYNHVAEGEGSPANGRVKQVTLQSFLHALGRGTVDFIKIDVEGSELTILSAARALLERGAIRAMMIEFNEENLQRYGGTCAALAGLLEECGYRFFAVDPVKFELVPVPLIGREAYANYFATQNENWLRNRFMTPPSAARKMAAEILKRGAHIAAFKQRLQLTISEQTSYIEIIKAERDRFRAETQQTREDSAQSFISGQKHIDALLAQLKKLTATSQQQEKYIAILEKERDRLASEAKASQAEVKRAAKDGQKQIDELLAQLNKLAATSREQSEYVAVLEKERHRLDAELAELLQKAADYLAVIKEQTDYIRMLEVVRDQNSGKTQ